MKKKKRKLKRKTRKNRGVLKKVVLLFILIAIPVAAFYVYSQFESEIVSSRAHNFMQHVEAGNLDEAESMMEVEDEELGDLHGLLSEQYLAYERIDNAYLTGFTRSVAEAVFSRDGKEYSVRMEMRSRDNLWSVSEIPPLKVLFGAFVLEETSGHLNVMYRGEESSYSLDEKIGLQRGDIVFLIVDKENVLLCEKAEKETVSRLLLWNERQIEGEEEGLFDLYSGGPAVYKFDNGSGNVEQGSKSDLVVGMRGVNFYLHDEKVLAVVPEEESTPDTKRVVLNDSSQSGLYHDEIRLTANMQYIMTDKDSGEEHTLPSGRIVTIQPEEDGGMTVTHGYEPAMSFSRRIVFEPVEETGRLLLTSITRDGWGGQAPSYRGTIDVFAGEEGLLMVSELPLEEYLYAVVPSEMPQNYGAEALKIQSIISRSYAYRGILNSRFHKYGAHLDDSVNSQVYNNNRETESGRQVVRETGGLVLVHNDSPVDAIYFSASCGYTANPEEVWADSSTGTFPGETISYLRAGSQVPGEDFYLADEEEFREFIETTYDNAYDRNSPYFRWQVGMSRTNIEETIKHNLEERYQTRPDLVLTEEEGNFVSREIPEEPLGELLDIRVVERGAGGNIMVLDIEGTEGTYRLVSEYVIRFTIRPVQYRPGGYPVILERGDGTSEADFDVLPSAFAYFDIIRNAEDSIERVIIKGGGFGHGVGLSQQGARRMVEQGYNFMEVLEHYYPGTQLVNITE